MRRREVLDKRVLIVGASGFIGSHLASALAQGNSRVVCVSRSVDTRRASNGATWDRCDASQKAEVEDILRRYEPEIIYHLTSDSRGGRELELIPASLQNDVTATVNVLVEAARVGGIHVVLTGSCEEPREKGEFPGSPYAAARATCTSYARMISALGNLHVTILRPMMVYGPRQKDYKVLPHVIGRLRDGQVVELGSAYRRLDWVYIDDVVDAFLRVGSSPWAGADPIDIGTGSLMRLRDSVAMIGEMMGRSDLLKFGALPDRAFEHEYAAEMEPARVKLGWQAQTKFADGIKATIESIAGPHAVGRREGGDAAA